MARHSLPHLAVTDTSLPGERSGRSGARPLLISLRPEQWTKNVIVFAGVIFGQRLLVVEDLARAIGAFVVFCALSSAMYLLNDLVDREEDRQHPIKARRPIAAGRLAAPMAATMAVLLSVTGTGAAFWLAPPMGVVSLAFVGLLATYSRVLKHIVILDVLAIACGFVLRAVAGALVVGVPISQWLLVCTVLLALFLALSKRRQEVSLLGASATTHRRALAEYTPDLLDRMITSVAAATLVSYAIYTTDRETVEKFATTLLTLTIPFPIYGVFRYLHVVQQNDKGGSPADVLLTDRPLLVCVALWVAAVVLIIYGPL